ncbi:neuraminidase-like domain-containing protein [Xenorhabdus nematophila]|uniref:Tc toxin subunit A-related protein n=1 Tax=Xenorhabdus nematophila TaxID=628 RepID=UPI0032B84B37
MQQTKLTGQMAERKRNALEAVWLGQLSRNNGTPVTLNTPDDIYNYLLIDTQSGWQLTTSMVAQVIASLQQYINNILLGGEPGYNQVRWHRDHQTLLDDWQSTHAQYDTWATNVLLAQYPENYLSPPLRTHQTGDFAQMVSDLSQGPLNDDTILTAVQGYLNRFEEVANLSVISGYVAGTDLVKSDYYFLGRTASKPCTYYWRKCAMHMNTGTTMVPDSWSEWLKVDLPLGGDNVVGQPRPVMQNNRLYVVWFERSVTVKQGHQSDKQATLAARMAYQKFDGTWSAPQSLGSTSEAQNEEETLYSEGAEFSTLALEFISADGQTFLYTALYTSKEVTWTTPGGDSQKISLVNDKKTAMVCAFDAWMNPATPDSDALEKLFALYALQTPAKDNHHTEAVNPKATGQQFLQRAVDRRVENRVTDTELTVDTLELGAAMPTMQACLGHQTKPNAVVLDVGGGTNGNDKLMLNFTPDAKERLSPTVSGQGGNNQSKVGSIRYLISFPPDYNVVNLTIWFDSSDKYNWVKDSYEGMWIDDLYYPKNISTHFDDEEKKLWSSGFLDQNKLDQNTVSQFRIVCRSQGKGYTFQFNLGKDVTKSILEPVIRLIINSDIEDLASEDIYNFELDPLNAEIDLPLARDQPYSFNIFTSLELWGQNSNGILEKKVKETYRHTTVRVTIPATFDALTDPLPLLDSRTDPKLGTAEFLHYRSKHNVGIPSPVRLNTLFARKLVNAAQSGLDHLFQWNTQLTPEPGIHQPEYTPTPMDFSGANGLYFWELFYHTPALVADTLQSRGQHAAARRWQQHIFNPSALNQGTDSQNNQIPNYWKVGPISTVYAKEVPSYTIEGPTNPDALAYTNPVHFRKASYMSYVQTQIALGDRYYRQLTPDSLNQALQIYTQTCELLGTRPGVGLVSTWVPMPLKDAAERRPSGEHMARFERELPSLPATWNSYPTPTDYPSVQTVTSAVFHSPVNNQLLMLWDTLDARRYNLRHNLDINGNPLHLPLFAAPLDPTALLMAEAQGGTQIGSHRAGMLTIPPYRYRVMSEKAREAAGMLSGFGQQLLQYLEASDERHKEILGQSQLADLWSFTQRAQKQAVDIAINGLDTLNTSLAAARQRYDYYQGLADRGNSALESAAMGSMASSAALMGAVSVPAIAAGAVALAPNIFGLADGGSDWAGPLKGLAESTMALGFAAGAASETMNIQAGFDRRKEEWQQQAEEASLDITTLQSQIKGQQLQIEAARTVQDLTLAQHQQVMDMYRFLSTRFTGEALYRWLIGQLSALYYQAYDATLSLCLAAQTCWQYELGDFETTFIQTGSWNDHYRGLLIGETLRLNLQQMEVAWLSRNTRKLEITRSFSLREKVGDTAWAGWLGTLKENGVNTFSLSEKDFDQDYPGHYLRQIASVSVSLPAVVGPYQNVRATLTQTGNCLVLKPDLEAVKYLKENKSGNGTHVKRNLNASQEIALSSGVDDNGVLVLNAGNERYLPFEGTGAVSDWSLAFPNPRSNPQQQILSSLNDIIVTVRYTARNGGNAFATEVMKVWQQQTE